MCRKSGSALLICVLLAGCAAPAAELTLATTTSVGNSGLLDVLLPAYKDQSQVVVQIHMVGSGRALAMLNGGQADVAITHAPAAEAVAIQDHPRWIYAKVMFNDFVLIGPVSDPAGVRGSPRAAEAMLRIARSRSRFISRGDQSGTHEREQALWKAAGAAPEGDRLVVAGASMGVTLRIAGETGSYTLTDRATYLQQKPSSTAVLYEQDPALLNTYAVVFDPGGPLGPQAKSFADWLTTGRGRDVIRMYTVGAGIRAFELWPLDRPRDRPECLPK
jgi:tungstate transport system substrate-binding protein